MLESSGSVALRGRMTFTTECIVAVQTGTTRRRNELPRHFLFFSP